MKSNFGRLAGVLALGAAGGALLAQPVAADDVADFYKGKNINLAIGYSAGGGYDVYSRTVARYMSAHIPGKPNFVVQNMPGAGSRKAANWLYNVAPKDGTAMAGIGQNTPLDQILRDQGIKFDVAKFNWIGTPIITNNMVMAWHTAEAKSLADLKAGKSLICGGTGASSPSILSPQMLNNLTGSKIRIISGYPGGSAVNLAMERGEVECRGSHNWASVKATLGDWLKDRKLNIIAQFGRKADPEISAYQGRDVPLIGDLAQNDLDRRAIGVLNSGIAMGRPLVAPPDVPADRIAALRAAFDATMKDPKFLAETKKQKMDVAPSSGQELQEVAIETASASGEVVARAKELIQRRDVEKLKK